MKNLKDLEKHIKEVEEKEDEIGEISVTGGGEAYDTPYAFKKKKKKKDESVYKQIASSLYLNEKNLDPVGKEDDDIDNDGDSDESDEYLKNRRKVISKAISESRKNFIKEAYNEGDTLTHKHITGLTITLVSPTNKGWKVTQKETHEPWGNKKLSRPKEKTAFFSKAELNDLFEVCIPVNEAKYRDYKKDESMSSVKKVNLAIKEVNRKLFEIERILDQSYKLKTEDGVGNTAYWKKTKRNLYKISEKMYRIGGKLRKY